MRIATMISRHFSAATAFLEAINTARSPLRLRVLHEESAVTKSMDGPPRPLSTHDEPSLLHLLRGGDLSAYEELWIRHHGAAITLAKSIAPGREEDLVSESFTAVLHTITVSQKGPSDGFRAYLFVTMRNNAARWTHDGLRTVPAADPELFGQSPDDAPEDALESAEDAALMLHAFRSLPERWQRVLWLSEVEERPRVEVAEQLGLRPNAVSALHRRARAGLRTKWLEQQIPEALRDANGHAAALLPGYFEGTLNGDQRAEVTAHLQTCETCREAHQDLQRASKRVGGKTLRSMGFAALGASFTALESGTGVAAAAIGTGVAATALSASGATKLAIAAAGILLVADVAVFGAGPRIIATSEDPAAASESDSAPPGSPATASPLPEVDPTPSANVSPTQSDDASEPSPAPSPTPPASTSGSGADELPAVIDLAGGGRPFTPPPAPTPALPGSIPAPSTPATPPEEGTDRGGTDPGGTDPDDGEGTEPGEPTAPAIPAPAVTVSAESSGYIAPTLSGSAPPATSVAIAIEQQREPGQSVFMPVITQLYQVPVNESGEWAFDLSALGLKWGTYTATVWQYSESESSTAVQVPFTIDHVGVTLLQETSYSQEHASVLGAPVDFDGPANGTVCLVTDTDQVFDIGLNADGRAFRVIRFDGTGKFELRFMNCAGDRYGPAYTAIVDVHPDDDVGFGGFGLEVERWVYVDLE